MNEQELVQRALIDVAQDPSSYYQGFVEDQLPLTKNISEEQFISLFSTGDETKTKKVLQELASDKKALTSIVKKFQQKSQASMFKEGGKFDYLKKLQGGGVTSEKLQGNVKPKGFKSLFFEATKYPREDGRPGYISEYITPAGDTTTTVAGRWNQWQRIAKNGQQPIYQIAVGSEDYKPTLDQEAIEMLNNVHNRFYYPVKKQEGGRLKRKDMLNQASANRGFTRQQARLAYNNARRAGLSRDAATQAVIGQPTIEETTATIERPTLINEVSAPVGQAIASQETISARPTRNYDNVDFGSFNFGDAFNKARGYGLNEFTWNGKRYTTELADITPAPTETPSKPIVDAFQKAIAPIVEDIRWNNEHRPYWADLKKKGGKLAKENEANKKYIKASEKAGAKASKEMSDLKAKHKAELKKIK